MVSGSELLDCAVFRSRDVVELTSTASRFRRRGKGWLMIASSKWQLLGYHVVPYSSPAPPEEPEWVVTYFASTLFTPAGLDIYSRTSTALSDEFVKRIVEETEKVGGEVAELVKDGGMFRIPHD